MENTCGESGWLRPTRPFPQRPSEPASANTQLELWVTGLAGMIGKGFIKQEGIYFTLPLLPPSVPPHPDPHLRNRKLGSH